MAHGTARIGKDHYRTEISVGGHDLVADEGPALGGENLGPAPYDLLLATDPKLVKMELDLYWATKAGHDPLTLFKQHPGRFPLWHVKDMDKAAPHSFTEVGNGSIDFKKIFAHANEAGLQYFFVEQDITPGSPFDSASKSLAYIKKNLV